MTANADAVITALRAASDEQVRADMPARYGIHTPNALGVTMAKMKAIAKPLGTDHQLAADLWRSGWYEARIVAALIDDPAQVTPDQMDQWCADFDNWAIVDTVCFNLFDRTPHAWGKVDQWAGDEREFVRRAAFALMWGLALHRRELEDEPFRQRLPLVERYAADERHLVTKAITMALRGLVKRRPGLRDDVAGVAERLVGTAEHSSRTIGRTILRELDKAT